WPGAAGPTSAPGTGFARRPRTGRARGAGAATLVAPGNSDLAPRGARARNRGLRRLRTPRLDPLSMGGDTPGIRGHSSAAGGPTRLPLGRGTRHRIVRHDHFTHHSEHPARLARRRHHRHRHALRRSLRAGRGRLFAALQTRIFQGSSDMKNTLRWLSTCALLACLCACALSAQARDSDSSGDNDRQVVSIGHNAELPAGQSAESVVAVMGDSRVDGDVSDSAVAVMGNVTVNGSAGDSAVAVMGNAYINGRITNDVVAVLGNVYLGPQAVIDGQVTSVMGRVERSSGSVIQGGTVNVMSGLFGNVEGLHAWIHDCLLFGRPLSPNSAVLWAWWLALATLGFYVLIAAIFQDGVRRCVHTLETHPGPSLLATVLAVLLLPVVLLALVITVVGIAVIPLLCIALFCAGIFGRIVAVGWVGGRCLRLNNSAAVPRPVLEVLVGGLVVLALYMVPVLGFFLYILLGVFGFGAVIYTILLAMRSAPPKQVPGGPGIGGASPAGTAGAGAPAGESPGGEHPAAMGGPATPPPWTATGAAAVGADSSMESGSTAGPPPPPPPPPSGGV